MSRGLRPASCERVRAQIALELDRDFSQLERARRRAHVAHCEECRAFETDLQEFTRLLRDAPPERPARPVALPRRNVGARSLRISSVAAAMVLALVGASAQLATQLVTGGQPTAARQGPTKYPTVGELQAEIAIVEVLSERPRLVAANANLR